MPGKDAEALANVRDAILLGGLLAASSLIVQKQPNAKELIAKLVPFQGIIGIILLIWGLIALIFVLNLTIRWFSRERRLAR